MTNKSIHLFAGAGMLFATILWGFGFVAVKDSLEVVPPIYMLAFRFTVASVAMCIVFLKKLRGLTRATIGRGVILSLFLFAAYAFQTIGCVYTTAGKNAFLTTIYVIFVPLIIWVFTRRSPGVHVLAAALFAILGIGLLSLQNDFSVNIGDVLTLICGFWYAIHIVFIAKFTQTDDPIVLTLLQIFFTALLSWLFAPLYDGAFPVAAVTTVKPVLSLLYLAIFSTMIAFVLQNVCQKYTAPSTAALLLSMESVFGALAAAIFLGEVMTSRMIFGCVLLFTAILLAETKFAFLTALFAGRTDRGKS
jgi:drug/metabolite transporter (DMT)-like permease